MTDSISENNSRKRNLKKNDEENKENESINN